MNKDLESHWFVCLSYCLAGAYLIFEWKRVCNHSVSTVMSPLFPFVFPTGGHKEHVIRTAVSPSLKITQISVSSWSGQLYIFQKRTNLTLTLVKTFFEKHVLDRRGGKGSDDKTSNIIPQANFRLMRVGGANLTPLLCAFLTQSNIVLGIFLESSYRVQRRRRRFPSFVHPF